MNKMNLSKSLLASVLRYFSIRDRSRGEFETYLDRKLHNVPDADKLKTEIIQKIEQFNLLNDYEFAQKWAISRMHRHKGQRYISLELVNKGVKKETITQAINSIPEEDWVLSARSYLSKKNKNWQNIPKNQLYAKSYQILSSRGYLASTIKSAIDDVLHQAVE